MYKRQVEGDAGAIGVKGSHIKVTNSQFYSNQANPFNNDLNTGLGGAIYTMGNNVTYDNAIFRYNTAVKDVYKRQYQNIW